MWNCDMNGMWLCNESGKVVGREGMARGLRSQKPVKIKTTPVKIKTTPVKETTYTTFTL
jgi:hypothetical protein